MNAWQVLEAELKRAFIDYAVREKANDKLRKLGMNVDQYIADFEFLAHHANVSRDDPTVTRLFADGLPLGLAEACIDLEKPKT